MMSNKEITQAAREVLRGQWGRAAGLTFVRMCCGFLAPLCLGLLMACLLYYSKMTSCLCLPAWGCERFWQDQVLGLLLASALLVVPFVFYNDLLSACLGFIVWMCVGREGMFVAERCFYDAIELGLGYVPLGCAVALVLLALACLPQGQLSRGYGRALWRMKQGESVGAGAVFDGFKRNVRGCAGGSYWLKVFWVGVWGVLILCLYEASTIAHAVVESQAREGEQGVVLTVTASVLSLGVMVLIPWVLWHTRLYVLAPWIVQNDGEVSAREALRKSKAMMKGRRLQLCMLQGQVCCWLVLPVAIGFGLLVTIDCNPVALGWFAVLLMLGLFWVPYYHLSMAKFYEILKAEEERS